MTELSDKDIEIAVTQLQRYNSAYQSLLEAISQDIIEVEEVDIPQTRMVVHVDLSGDCMKIGSRFMAKDGHVKGDPLVTTGQYSVDDRADQGYPEAIALRYLQEKMLEMNEKVRQINRVLVVEGRPYPMC